MLNRKSSSTSTSSQYLWLCGYFLLLLLLHAAIILDSSQVLLHFPILQSLLPTRAFWHQAVVGEGVLPLWNPLLYGGIPFWADPKSASAYPLNIIYFLFSPEHTARATTIFLLCHIPLAFLGVWKFLRLSSVGHAPASIFAFAYATSGIMLSSLGMLTILAAATALPWFAYFLRLSRRCGFVYISGASLGLMISLVWPLLGGGAEFTYFFSIYLLLQLCQAFSLPKLKQTLFLGGGAIFLAMIVLLPGIPHLLASERGLDKLGEAILNQNSFHPWRLLEFFLNLPFGNIAPSFTYWGSHLLNSSDDSPLLLSKYLGSSLSLGLVGYFTLIKPRRIFQLGLLLILFWLAFGIFAFINLHGIFGQIIPLWQSFRYPEKFTVFISFILLIMQARGWARILALLKIRRLPQRAILIIFAALCFIPLLFYFLPQGIHQQKSWTPVFLWLGFLSLQVGALILMRKYQAIWSYRWLILGAIFFADLSSHVRHLTWGQPLALLESPLAEAVKRNLYDRAEDLAQGGAFRFSSQLARPQDWFIHPALRGKLDTAGLQAFSAMNRLLPSTGILHGIADIAGMGVVVTADKADFINKVSQQNVSDFLSIMGAYYVLVPTPGAKDHQGAEAFTLSINQAALPYVFMPARVNRAGNPLEIANAFARREKDWRFEAQIETPTEISGANPLQGQISHLRREAAKRQFTFTRSQPATSGWLVLQESYDQHWRAYIGGIATPITRANGWSMAIYLDRECGERCDVQFVYKNPLIDWGIAMTIIFLVFFIGAIIIKRTKLLERNHGQQALP